MKEKMEVSITYLAELSEGLSEPLLTQDLITLGEKLYSIHNAVDRKINNNTFNCAQSVWNLLEELGLPGRWVISGISYFIPRTGYKAITANWGFCRVIQKRNSYWRPLPAFRRCFCGSVSAPATCHLVMPLL